MFQCRDAYLTAEFTTTEKLYQINMSATAEKFGITTSSSLKDSNFPSSVLFEQIKSALQKEFSDRFKLDDEENNLKKELTDLQDKLVELLQIIDHNHHVLY